MRCWPSTQSEALGLLEPAVLPAGRIVPLERLKPSPSRSRSHPYWPGDLREHSTVGGHALTSTASQRSRLPARVVPPGSAFQSSGPASSWPRDLILRCCHRVPGGSDDSGRRSVRVPGLSSRPWPGRRSKTPSRLGPAWSLPEPGTRPTRRRRPLPAASAAPQPS